MEHSMKRIMVAASLALVAAGPAFAQSSRDAAFIDNRARDGLGDVEIGQLASKKAASPEVRSFADRLVADDTKANQELMSIAQSEKISPPSTTDEEHNALRTKLEPLSGASFDRAFIRSQIDDQKKDIQYLESEVSLVKDPQLTVFIRQTLPVKQQQLQMAQQIETQLSSLERTVAPTR
jgi:putative membrane protein